MKDKEKVREIIEEQYKKIMLEQAQDAAQLEDMLDTAIGQMNEHAELMKEVTFYLTTEEDDKDLAQEFVKAHGAYTRILKEVQESIG